MAMIEDLQEELLLKIFSHYVRSEGHEAFSRNIPGVCKHFNDLSSAASLWKDVRAGNPNYLVKISRRGLLYHTHSIQLFNCLERVSDMHLRALLANIQSLKALDLMFNRVSSIAIKLVAENCPNLERLRLRIDELEDRRSNTTSHEWDQFVTVCGPTLKSLELWYWCSWETGQHLVSGIAAKCPLIERLVISLNYVPFPIYELRSGCPRLRHLELDTCKLIADGKKDSSMGCGFFKDLKKFKAIQCDFGGLELAHLLKDSINFEHLELFGNDGLAFNNISKIPTNKVTILDIMLRDPEANLKVLEDAVWKWRHTLTVLNLRFWKCDITNVIKQVLQDNPNPQLETLAICDNIDTRFFRNFIEKCQNLIHLEISGKEYDGREKIKEASEFLMKRENINS